jgi:hypothetical protein
VKHFKDANVDTADLHHTSRPRTSTMEYNEQKVDALITEDQRAMTREIVLQPHTGHNVMQVMLKTLKYQKVCHYWVSQLLMDNHETVCIDVLLQQLAAEGDDFLLNIVTGDES